MWLHSSSESRPQQRGCLEALYLLCQAFPPPSVPEWWGCQHGIPSLLPTSLSLLTSSHLAWTVQGRFYPLCPRGYWCSPTGQQQLLDVCSDVFLACSLSAMTRSAQSGLTLPASGWAALGGSDLAGHAILLLQHVARLLALFVHVIEGREPETRETRVRELCVHLCSDPLNPLSTSECRWCPLRRQVGGKAHLSGPLLPNPKCRSLRTFRSLPSCLVMGLVSSRPSILT